MKPFNCIKTAGIQEGKQTSSHSFKSEITYKQFTFKSYMYIHSNGCKQMINIKKRIFVFDRNARSRVSGQKKKNEPRLV